MFKIDFFFFKLSLILSMFHTFVFTTSVGKFRLLHFCIPIMLIMVARQLGNQTKLNKYKDVFLYLLAFLSCGGLTYFTSTFRDGTVRIVYSMTLNYVVFFYFICFLEYYKNRTPQIFKFLKNFVQALCALIVLQWVGALAHLVPILQPGEGLLTVGRPGLFFGDPNWASYYIMFLYIIVDTIYASNAKSKFRLVVLVALLFMQSRIFLLCFAFHYVYCARKSCNNWIFVPFVLITLLLFIDSSILMQFLPERFFYDLSDSDNNPRLHDITNLTEEVTFYHRENFGMGWGSLGKIADFFPYRNYDITINVWPAQVYFDFGKFGFYIFIALLVYAFYSIKDIPYKFMFIFFVLSCCFHMPGYNLFTWVLLPISVFLYKNKQMVKKT